MKKQLEKAYIVLGNSTKGKLISPVENSFSIGFSSTEAMLFRDNSYGKGYDKAKRYLDSYRKVYPLANFKIYRVGSKNCPVKIDWKRYHSYGDKIPKYEYRNLKFIKK